MRLKEFLAFISILLMFAVINAETYKFTFTGGLNNAFDSTDLAPDEALLLKNLTFEYPNVLTSRHGFSSWNNTQVDTFPIDNIFFYEPYPDTIRLVFACNGFIYIADTSIVDTISDWDSYRLGFSDDSLYVTDGINVPARPSPSWWYARVCGHDILSVNGSEYTIRYVQPVTDTILYLGSAYSGSNGYADFTIYKRMAGDIIFEQFGSKLYISSNWSFPIVYDDTTYKFLCLLDSGQVDASFSLDADYDIYDAGQIQIYYNSNIAQGSDDALFGWSDSSGLTGDGTEILRFRYSLFVFPRMNIIYREFASPIMDIDSANNTLTLGDAWETAEDSGYYFPHAQDREYRDYTITSQTTALHSDADSAITDRSKNWFDDIYGSRYLSDMYFVSGTYGYNSFKNIYGNSDSTFQIEQDTFPFADDYYYIFTALPFSDDSSANGSTSSQYFSQIEFYNNQLFGIGGTKTNVYNRIGFNKIFNSDINMPSYIKSNYNTDMDYTDILTSLFKLKDYLYATSNNSIYFISGNAGTDVLTGNLEVRKISNAAGVNDIDNVIPANVEYAYFADETGLYRFNGVRPEKISYSIDKAIEKYWDSECVLGYYDQQLYNSFPDSGITYCYDERYGIYYGYLDFGISSFNTQSSKLDVDVFYFANPEFDGMIFYYPNELYKDTIADSSITYTCQYKTGWQSLGGIYNEELETTRKKLTKVIVEADKAGDLDLFVYVDKGASAIDTVTFSTSGSYIYTPSPNGSCVGERFQLELTNGTKSMVNSRIIIRSIEVEYEWAAPKTSD